MGISLEAVSKKARSLISTTRDKLPVGLRSTKSKEAYNGVKDNADQNRPHITSINKSKDGSLFIYAKTLPHTPDIKIPKNLTAEGLKEFLDGTNEKLGLMHKEFENFKKTNIDERTLYVSEGKIKSFAPPKKSKILPFNSDTLQTSIKNLSSKKADFLKDNNIQKSKDRLGRTRLSFIITTNDGTTHKIKIPRECQTSDHIQEFKTTVENIVKSTNLRTSYHETGYNIKNGNLYLTSEEQVPHEVFNNGLEFGTTKEYHKELVTNRIK